MNKPNEIEGKIEFLKGLSLGDMKAHNSRASVLEALIALGDRRLSKVIYQAWLKGARFDQWGDRLRDDIWMQALRESDMDLDFYVYRKKEKDEIFAWDHLDFGVNKETLYEEYLKGLIESGETKEDVFAQKSELPLTFDSAESPENIAPLMRVRLRFSKKGALKFISHLEQIEALRRAIRRSSLPAAFSAGFSPQIKASFGPPLPVGYESLSEYVDLSLTENIAESEIKQAISKTLPLGFELLDVKRIPVSFPSSDALANIAEFKISNFNISQKGIDDFLKQDKIIVKKIKKEKVLEIDAKPIIKDMTIKDGALLLRLYIGQAKNIKPEVLIAAMDRTDEDLSIKRTKLLVEISDGKIFEL
jgi:radical SAM-linked protein